MKNLLKTKVKDMKAITLIALIITIVILIILAGVIISITVGNGGIIDRTKRARTDYLNAQEFEKQYADELEGTVEGLVNGNGSQTFTAEMIEFKPTWKAKDGSDITNVKQALDFLYGN